ncbi:MAG: ATP-binding protein [Gammaproteobacteria bacterium]|nr:ATP-binding protein [Gammaproteobacteria bacterium]
MDIKMADVMIHVDETLSGSRQQELVDSMRQQKGVVAVGHHEEKSHLMVVEYNPDETDSTHLLSALKAEGVHAELIGL